MTFTDSTRGRRMPITSQLAFEPLGSILKIFQQLSSEMSDNNAENEDRMDEEIGGFQLLRTYFDKKFEEQNNKLEEKITEDTRHLEKRLKMKSKSKKETPLKYRGNEIQHKFNLELIQSLEELKLLVERGSITRSTKRIKDIISSVQKRNKCIKFADKSPAGWAAVDEYLSDELASNSDDDKRMKLSENRAMAKRKSEKRKYPFRQPSATITRPYQNTNFAMQQQQFRAPPPPPPPSGRPPFNGYYQQQPAFQQRFQPPTNSLCYGCGKPGHWRRDCEEIKHS